jgi:diguanylate cyclase (GGDEF)-like protein
LLFLAAAAWLPVSASEPAGRAASHSIALPIVLATAVIGLLAASSIVEVGVAAVGLGVATLLVVLARLGRTFRANRRILADSQHEAITDSLTGLPNRRSLMADLTSLPAGESVLALFDLNGFKSYNDSFGHTAGDDLLQRLGGSLGAATAPWGRAYRLGGDEFCVLASTEKLKADAIVSAAKSALSDQGPGFSIGASCGSVRLPAEADNPTEALRLADRRMYMEKGHRADSALSQARNVLLGLLREREPGLDPHDNGVAQLATETGKVLGLDAEDLDVLARAAEMHDIGKVAIPDEILHKPGPLTAAEQDLMRKHAEIGERVLYAAPALRAVGKLVRATHEHWDGSGYPDGLAGDAIPLGSRIISAADTYDVMTSRDSYRRPVSSEAALAELRRVAGTQLDPQVVEVFERMILERRVQFSHTDEADFETELAFEKRVADYARPRVAVAA